MNEPSTNPIIMGLLFVLRCLIPLGVLFGISYLLRRLEVFADQAEEAENPTSTPEPTLENPEVSLPINEEKAPPVKKPKSIKKKKPAAPKKRSRKQ